MPSWGPRVALPLSTLPLTGVPYVSVSCSVEGTEEADSGEVDSTEAETWLGSELSEGGWLAEREGSSI